MTTDTHRGRKVTARIVTRYGTHPRYRGNAWTAHVVVTVDKGPDQIGTPRIYSLRHDLYGRYSTEAEARQYAATYAAEHDWPTEDQDHVEPSTQQTV